MFDTFEEASDLIVQCGICGKDRIFYVKQVGDKYNLVRCEWEYCLDHCKCGVPELTNNFDHNDIVSSVSMYV